jgi:phage terminase small subunit
MALTVRQSRFVENILAGMAQKVAAEKAGFSKKSAEQQAVALMKLPEVAAAINEALRRRSDRVEVKADDVLRELARIGMSDMAEAFNDDGTLKPLVDMPLDVRRAISSVEVEQIFEGRGEDRKCIGTLTKVKFWDKTRGLEMLGKNLKLFTEVHEHRLGKGLADRLIKAKARVSAR